MSRAIRVFLLLVIVLAPGTAHVYAQADSRSSPTCHKDALLMRPVAPSAPQPPSEVVAVSLEGAELARFSIEDPELAVTSAVPGRALVLDVSGQLTFIDLESRTTTIVPPIRDDHRWSPGTFEIRLPDSSQYAAFASRGPTDTTWDWLLDFETQQTISLSQLFTIVDPLAYLDFAISANGTWAVANGPAVVAAAFNDPANRYLLTDTYPRTRPEFHPTRPIVAFWVSDGVTAHLSTVDLDILQGADADLAAHDSSLSDIEYVDEETMLYAVDGTVVFNTWSSNTRQTFDTGLAAVAPVGLWNGGNVILVREVDPEDHYTVLGWHLMDRDTGAMTAIDGLAGAQPLPVATPTRWIPFVTRNDFADLETVSLLDTTDGSVETVVELLEPNASSRVVPAGEHTAIVFEARAGGSRIVAVDLALGSITELMVTDDVTKIDIAPDGCSVAIGVYRVTPDIREAGVDVVDLRGVPIAHFDESRLIGWVPGA